MTVFLGSLVLLVICGRELITVRLQVEFELPDGTTATSEVSLHARKGMIESA